MNANNTVGGAGVGGGVTGQMPVLEREEPSVWIALTRSISLQRMRDFLRLNGTGILYALSAMSILYGMGRIIGPILATSGKLGETLPCFGALQGYELALFAVLLLIVLWRQKTRDTTTLMVLVALFLGASGITLATIANDGPVIAAVIGVACMTVAFGKLWVLRSKIGMVCSGLFMAGLSALLVWNFLVSPYMALTLHREWPGSGQLRLVWLGGWHVMLFGAALLFVSALMVRTGGARRAGPEHPFLRSTGMAWVFALVLVGGTIVHQYALTYIFDVRFAAGDFLPVAVIVAAAALEIMRGYGVHGTKADMALALAPFALVFAVVREHVFLVTPQWGLGMLFQPWAVLALAGLALLVIAVRRREKVLAGIALLYAPSPRCWRRAAEFTVRTPIPGPCATCWLCSCSWRRYSLGQTRVCAVVFLAFAQGSRKASITWPSRYSRSRLDVFWPCLRGRLGLTSLFPRSCSFRCGNSGGDVSVLRGDTRPGGGAGGAIGHAGYCPCGPGRIDLLADAGL